MIIELEKELGDIYDRQDIIYKALKKYGVMHPENVATIIDAALKQYTPTKFNNYKVISGDKQEFERKLNTEISKAWIIHGNMTVTCYNDNHIDYSILLVKH